VVLITQLPARYVAHTVGPVYSSSNADRSQAELESCYRTSLEHCKDRQAETIGFSSISTGICEHCLG
jgi:O-acetyl-ADP-ribose deacetylase (regulator of RNase III)